MTYDPLEWTVRDPLEDTVPDPVARRIGLGRRRAMELTALLVLAPGLLVTQWVDNEHQSRAYQTREHVTVVGRGATGTLDHVQLRMLGRDATGAAETRTTPGAVSLKLVLQARPLDATGVKNLTAIGYTVRDKAGHVWSASGSSDPDNKPPVGGVTQVTVLVTVPEHLVNAVLLEARPPLSAAQRGTVTPVLRFAH